MGESRDGVSIQTALGTIDIEIDTIAAPVTASRFLALVDQGAYNGGRFYRTVTMNNQPDDAVMIEVIQGGVGETFDSERAIPIPLERTNATGLKHIDGAISMARRTPDSATTEFFICIGDQPELDFGGKRNPDGQGFAAFGFVSEGMDVVRKIHQARHDDQRLEPTIAIQEILRVE